jgi:phosphatidylserine/phosphatidylglycerophosphate/cardiolipin synthase-like enzyme
LNRIQIVGTGPDFIGLGVRSVEPVVEELLRGAKREIHLAAYLFTPEATGLINLLEAAADRGVRQMIVVNRLSSQDATVRSRLTELASNFADVDLRDYSLKKSQLHAKVVVADRSRALVGSANFTWGGMVSNYELGVLVEGELCWQLAHVIDVVARKAKPVRSD